MAPTWFQGAMNAALAEHRSSMDAALAQLRISMNAGLAELQNSVDTVQASNLEIRNSIRAVHITSAKAFNSSAQRVEDHILPVPNAEGNVPPMFPATIRDLTDLTHDQCNLLCQHLQLQHATLLRPAKVNLIASSIGVRVNIA